MNKLPNKKNKHTVLSTFEKFLLNRHLLPVMEICPVGTRLRAASTQKYIERT